jgi:hypothetical protein
METKYQEAFLSKYKIEPSTLIEKIATKYFGKIKSIGLTTLISEEVEKDGIEANEEFYKMLIEALAEGGVKLPENQKLQEVNVAFEIPNQQVSIPKSKGDLQDFKDIVSTDDLRPVMMGVYVSKDGYLVGTDAHKLVKFKSNLFYGEEVDKIIDLKKYIGTNGKSIDFIDGKYPNYDAIIPRDNEYKRTSLNTYAFYNFCKSTIYLKKYQTSDIFHLTLLIEGKEYKFNPILFAELLEFALRKGFENFDIEVSESQTRAMLLKFAGGSEGLIMPIYSDSNVPRTIPYEIDEIQRLFRSGKTAKKSASPSPKKPKAIETPKTEAFKKFEGDIEDTTYVSRREIRSIELESGEMLSKNDVIDGFYRLKKKYEVGGVVERYDNPLFNQGMQGELSGFGTSSPMSVFANGGTTDPQKFNQDNLMAEGGKMSIIEQILKKYNVQEDKTDETRDWLKKEWEGKNIDDYVMYSDKYGRGGKTASIGDSGIITDKNSMFVGKMALITGDLGNMYEVQVGERTTIVKKNGINIIADEDSYYAKGGEFRGGIRYVDGKELEWVDIMSFDIADYGEKEAEKKAYDYIEKSISYWKGELNKSDFKVRKSANGKDFEGSWVVMRQYPKYAKGGEVGKDYVFVGNTMMNGEYKPVYKKDNKYYLKYYNPTKYNFLADEKDIKNYRIGRATDTFSKGGQTSNYEVHLEAVPNRDYDQSYYRANVKVSKLKKSAKSIDEAVSIVKNFIEDNDLGSGNFIPAKLYKNGKQIGFISYNGRVWNNDQSEMSYAKGGEVSNNFRGIDLFEDYEMQEPKLRKIVQKINDAYDEDEVNTKFLQSRLDEAEKIGYTFEIDMDGSAYGLRPKEVEITELKGFEEGEYFAKGGEIDSNTLTIDKIVGTKIPISVGSQSFSSYDGWTKDEIINLVGRVLKHNLIDTEFYYNYLSSEYKKEYLIIWNEEIYTKMMKNINNVLSKYFHIATGSMSHWGLEWNLDSKVTRQLIDNFFRYSKKLPQKVKDEYAFYRDDYAGVDINKPMLKQANEWVNTAIEKYNTFGKQYLNKSIYDVPNDYYNQKQDWIDRIEIDKKYKKKQILAKGGEVEITNSTIDRGGLGNVQDSILAKGGLLKKVESFGKKAMKKAKPVAKKIVRKTKKYGAVALKKAKIGFDALAEKVAESYEGKKVKPKYQGEYGKTYSKAEAKEVGEKVSAKVYRQQLGKRKITRKLRNKTK